MKKLTVIIVSYNVKYYIEQCVTSLRWALRDVDSEIIIVDNHSRDNSVEYLRKRFGKDVTIISSNHNLGFSRANNLGIDQSDSEYVLLLNPDTIVTEEAMAETISFMDEHPNAGALGVRMLKADGSNAMESRRGVPTPMAAFYKMCGLCSLFPNSKRFGHYYMGGISWNEPHKIDVVSGAFCLLRRSALLKAGKLDEDYFMYGEDIDLSYQLLQNGYDNWYVPSVILHYKGESTHKSSFRYVHVFYNAMLIFFRKNFGGYSFFISLPIKLAIITKATIAAISMMTKSLRDSMGLRNHKEYEQPKYIFIGSRFTLDQCRNIAQAKGLEAEFHEGNIGTLPEGHNVLSLPENRKIIVVYDVHAYKYDQIFQNFAVNPRSNITIGTYDSNTQKIITLEEVIYNQHSKL